MASINRKIKKVGYYLIADHPSYGKDQVMSRGFHRYPDTVVGRELNDRNAELLEKVVLKAKMQDYGNFRIVSVESVAITIPQGIIGWKQIRTRVAKY